MMNHWTYFSDDLDLQMTLTAVWWSTIRVGWYRSQGRMFIDYQVIHEEKNNAHAHVMQVKIKIS